MPTTAGRVRHLDGIRGIAILAVVCFHWIGSSMSVGSGGYIGVDLFFVLSGFIITTLLIKRRPSYRQFIAGRMRRLYPPLLGMLAIGLLLAWLWPQSRLRVDTTALHALVAAVQGSSIWAASGHSGVPFAITWSLAVEWMFYLLWPLAVHRLTRLPARQAVGWCLVAAAVVYAASLAQPALWFYFSPVARFAELLVGAALGFALVGGITPAGRLWGILATAGMVFVGCWTLAGPGHLSLAYRLIGLPATCAVAAIWITAGHHARNAATRLLSWKPLTSIGLISYSLYLWHILPIALISRSWMGLPLGAVNAVRVAMVLGCTGLGWLLLERPFTRSARVREQASTPVEAALNMSSAVDTGDRTPSPAS